MISAVITHEDNRVSIHSSRTSRVGTTFEQGMYEADTNQGQIIINTKEMPESHNVSITEEIQDIGETVKSFFKENMRERVNEMGFLHKMGILLYGKQGTGKTSLLNNIARIVIEKEGAIVFICDTSDKLSAAVELSYSIREIQDNPIVFIADEFERYASGMESAIKNFLDGHKSVDNSLFLAATNYLDRVPDTLKNRPSRFKIVREIQGFSDKGVIKTIIENIASKSAVQLFEEGEIERILEENSSLTIDEIKHICLDKVMGLYLKGSISSPQIGFSKKKETESGENSNYLSKVLDDFWNSAQDLPSKDTLESNVFLVNWDNPSKQETITDSNI